MVLILALTAVLVATAGFGTWWYLLQGSENGGIIRPVAGLDQAPRTI